MRKVVKLRVDKGRDRDKQRQGVEQGLGVVKEPQNVPQELFIPTAKPLDYVVLA